MIQAASTSRRSTWSRLLQGAWRLGAGLAVALAFTPLAPAHAKGNPFVAPDADHGVLVAMQGGKCGEGKCGGAPKAAEPEAKCGKCGKCGAAGKEKTGDRKCRKCGEGKCPKCGPGKGKCGEGKCGEGKAGKCGPGKGKCGEGKCAAGKCGSDPEGKGGEGKCGGAEKHEGGKCGEGKCGK